MFFVALLVTLLVTLVCMAIVAFLVAVLLANKTFKMESVAFAEALAETLEVAFD